MLNLLSTLICYIFEKEIGANQSRKPLEERRGLLASFASQIDYGVEEGYRYVDLLIYAGLNYVEVWTRNRWCVTPCDPGDNLEYAEGSSVWEKLSYHDSCWREDGVHRFFNERRGQLLAYEGLTPYKAVSLEQIKDLGVCLVSHR